MIMSMKISSKNLLFYLGYILILVSLLFGKVTFIEKYLPIIEKIGLAILILLFIIQFLEFKGSIKWKRLILFTILSVLGILSYYKSDSLYFLKFVLIISTITNLDFEDFLKKDVIIKSILILTVIILYFLGYTDNVLVYRSGNVIRYSLGLGHPNTLGMYIAMILTEVFWIRRNKNNIFLVTLSIGFLVFIKYITDSRSSMVVLSLVILLSLLNNKKWLKIFDKKYLKLLVKCSFIILSVLSLGLCYIYAHKYLPAIKLNSILSNRLYWWTFYLKNYDLNLLGNKLFIPNAITKYLGRYYLSIDNAFIYTLLEYGILIWVFYGLMFYLTFIKMYKEKEYYLIGIMVVLMLSGLMEICLISFNFNPFILLFSSLLFNENKITKDSETNEK